MPSFLGPRSRPWGSEPQGPAVPPSSGGTAERNAGMVEWARQPSPWLGWSLSMDLAGGLQLFGGSIPPPRTSRDSGNMVWGALSLPRPLGHGARCSPSGLAPPILEGARPRCGDSLRERQARSGSGLVDFLRTWLRFVTAGVRTRSQLSAPWGTGRRLP